MTALTNLRKLLVYLEQHPDLEASSDDERFQGGPRKFLRYEAGRLWTVDAAGNEQFLPIACRVDGSETGLLIDERGFTVEKFGRTFRYQFSQPPEE